MGWCGLKISGLGQGPMVGFSEHSNEPSAFMKHEEFLD